MVLNWHSICYCYSMIKKEKKRCYSNPRVPQGTTKPLKDVLRELEKGHENEVKNIKASYEVFKRGEYRDFYYPPRCIFETMTLEEYLQFTEKLYRRKVGHIKYNYMRRTNTKDNQSYYNTSTKGYADSGENHQKIRVPSLKRSNRVWRNFYELFPYLKGKETYNGLKLKQID